MKKLAPQVLNQLAIAISPNDSLSVTGLNISGLCYVLYTAKMGFPLRLPFLLAHSVEMLCTQGRGTTPDIARTGMIGGLSYRVAHQSPVVIAHPRPRHARAPPRA